MAARETLIGRAVFIVVFTLAFASPADAKLRIGWQDQRAAFHADDAHAAYRAARAINARSMRLIVLWDEVQPARGIWRWADYDRAVHGARAQGFAVHLTLGGVGRNPPAWAAGGAPPHHNGSVEAWSRIDESAYHAFVKAAARRYTTQVKLWSILNEVDISGFPAIRYARLFKVTRNSIRRLAPGSRVLWGDFAPSRPLSYTRRALAATRDRTEADGFAWHPYPDAVAPSTEGWLERTPRVAFHVGSWSRRTSKALTTPNGRALPLYATEFGCHTVDNDEAECARQWGEALSIARGHHLRQLVAYQLLPGFQSWDTSIVRRDGSPSRAMTQLRSDQHADEKA